jgi:hypothetical protein
MAAGKHARGSTSNPDARYFEETQQSVEDGWDSSDEQPETLKTSVVEERLKSIVFKT